VVQAELAGISIATKELTRKSISGKNIIICTDSRQVLLALNRRDTSGLVLECHQDLANASVDNYIILRWVKGHDRSKGNHIADLLARKVAY